MTKCALKLLEPEELMNQDLDVENLYVLLVVTSAADVQGTIPDYEGQLAVPYFRHQLTTSRNGSGMLSWTFLLHVPKSL